MYDFDEDDNPFGVPRWWPGFPISSQLKCKDGCGITVERPNERCLDCDVKANLPTMELALEEIRGER